MKFQNYNIENNSIRLINFLQIHIGTRKKLIHLTSSIMNKKAGDYDGEINFLKNYQIKWPIT
jgi:hypothetical protein